ncbi:hypothetical protein HNY73_013167 [Argiope bruennichi]|uniref:Uncharacterized protein n=1 Tax=Argiope bruennichi TaxID=94029 RepID=A0A8T0EZA9_ARGBR|nr:hypothetical protein HNY73_013167 [Argiope bruennichi]
MGEILIRYALIVALLTLCEITNVVSIENKPNTFADLVQIVLGRIDGESYPQSKKIQNQSDQPISNKEANMSIKINQNLKNYRDLGISVEVEEGTVFIPNVLRTEITTEANINHLTKEQNISQANQSKPYGTQVSFSHIGKQNIFGSSQIFSKIYSLILEDFHSSTLRPHNKNIEILTKEKVYKSNDLNDSIGIDFLSKALSNNQRRVSDSLRRFLYDHQKLISGSDKIKTQITMPEYLKFNPDQTKQPADEPVKQLLKSRDKIIRFTKEYDLKKKQLKTYNNVNNSSHHISAMHKREKLKFKNGLKSLRRKFHVNHHHYRKRKLFNNKRKIQGNWPTARIFHHGLKESHYKSHKKHKKGAGYKKTLEFLLPSNSDNLTSFENFEFLEHFSKSLSSLDSKAENLKRTLNEKLNSTESVKESATELSESSNQKDKNISESENERSINADESDYPVTFINYSSRRSNKDKRDAIFKNFKVWILFIEAIVSISTAGTLLVFIYCRVRHHLRKLKTATANRDEQQYRWKLMNPVFKNCKEINESSFKKENGNYRKLIELSNENVVEFLTNTTAKIDTKTKNLTKSDLEFHGENTTESDLIQLKSPLKSKVNAMKYENFSKKFFNKKNEDFNNIRHPKYSGKSKVLDYIPYKINSNTKYFSEESKQYETGKQKMNLSSLQLLNFDSESSSVESKELLDLEIKPERENDLLFSENGNKEKVDDSSIQKRSELSRNHMNEEENNPACLSSGTDKRMPFNDLKSQDTQLLIWNRSYVIEEQKEDQNSVRPNHNHSKIIKKIYKEWKSKIPCFQKTV